MTPARILVVEHEADAGIGLVGERITAAGLPMVVAGPETGQAVPESAEGFAGVVVLGGSPSPSEDVAPLPRVRALIADCLAREVPLLAICLGHQLLGSVAGGTLAAVEGGPEVGLFDLNVMPDAIDDPLLAGLPHRVRALEWHSYEVRDLPPGSVSFVSSARCSHQAFRVGPNAWGLQFHLEAMPATLDGWADVDPDSLAQAGLDRDRLRGQLAGTDEYLRRTWAPVADLWIDLVRSAP